MTTLELVRAKVIEAVPEIELVDKDYTIEGVRVREGRSRPITLADVLRAIDTVRPERPISVAVNGVFIEETGYEQFDILGTWNFALPLDEQEPEVIDFLAKILV